jgi:hypothetical protein
MTFEAITDAGLNLLQRIKQALREVITWLNGLFTLVALYALAHHDVHEKLLPFIPENYRSAASVLLPLATFWLVQKGKEIDKARTIAQSRLPS